MSNKRKLKMVSGDKATMDLLRSFGLDPKAPPRSGRCMLCGNDLTAEDKDHSLCNGCFPEDMAELQGVSYDYARVDFDTGKVTPIEPPADPFVSRARDSGCHTARDPRIAYGYGCLWWGSIYEVAKRPSGLPCCPHCGGMLMECENEVVWWKGNPTSVEGIADYHAFLRWLRGKCFPTMEAALAARARGE